MLIPFIELTPKNDARDAAVPRAPPRPRSVWGGHRPSASVAETLGLLGRTAAALVAKGVIVRRPWVVRAPHGTGAARSSWRRRGGIAVVLHPDPARRVPAGATQPFGTDAADL